MTIRQYVKELQSRGFEIEIVGKLTRRPECEQYKKERVYTDDGGNEYYTHKGNIVIVTADGGVI